MAELVKTFNGLAWGSVNSFGGLARASIKTFNGIDTTAGGFVPTDIAGCQLWLDASQIVGLNDGDAISVWNDESGNGNDPTINFNFTYKTGIVNGLPVARAALSLMTLTDFSALTAATMFFVFKNATTSGNTIYALAESSTDPNSYIPLDGGGTYDSFFSTVRKNNFSSGIVSEWNIYCVRSASADWTCHVNGVSKHSTGTNTVSAPSAGTIGGVSGGSWGVTTGGDIAEIILYDSALGTTDRQTVEAYLAAKYNL